MNYPNTKNEIQTGDFVGVNYCGAETKAVIMKVDANDCTVRVCTELDVFWVDVLQVTFTKRI